MSIPMHGGSLPREYKEAQYFSAMGTLSPQDTHPWVSLYHDSTSVMFLLALIHLLIFIVLHSQPVLIVGMKRT